VDNFIKAEIKKRGIDTIYNTKLVEIDKDSRKLVLENTTNQEKSTRDYENLYSIIPNRPRNYLVKANLATKQSNYLLDVDRQTL
jgi:thioredoxin reductase